MEYRQHQLANGLQIVSECNDRAYTAAFGYFVRTGSRDETPEIAGVSHFLEHMVFKGTSSLSAEEVNLRLDELGSSSNARTSEESTIYHSSVLPEFQTPMVELLSDLMRPSLRDDDFEMEKQVIIEEIKMYQDQPPYGGHEKIMEDFFSDHPLSQSVLGTEDSVGQMSPADMRNYFAQRYSPGNMCLAAAGNVDFQKLVDDAERLCGHWESFDAARQPVSANYRGGFEQIVKANSHQQYLMQLSPGPSASDPDRFAVRVVSAILGDDGGSRMFWEFLDSGKAESAGMGAYEYFDSGLVMTYICCAPEEAQDNLVRLHQLQTQAVARGITQRELDLAKRKIASHIVLASERTSSRLFSVGSQWLVDQPFLTTREIAAIYESVTLDQVTSVLEKYPLTQNMTLVVGPRTDLQPVE